MAENLDGAAGEERRAAVSRVRASSIDASSHGGAERDAARQRRAPQLRGGIRTCALCGAFSPPTMISPRPGPSSAPRRARGHVVHVSERPDALGADDPRAGVRRDGRGRDVRRGCLRSAVPDRRRRREQSDDRRARRTAARASAQPRDLGALVVVRGDWAWSGRRAAAPEKTTCRRSARCRARGRRRGRSAARRR